MTTKQPATSAAGFEGEISGLGLSDIVQLSAVNRFSGCIEVRYEGRRGVVFMRDGQIIHAEHGTLTGEPAFYEIVSWPGGRFTLQEKVATTRSTISKSCGFLLLEAHRLMDERGAVAFAAPARNPSAPAPAATAAAPRQATAASVLERLRAIPGALHAVVQPKDGSRIGYDSYDAESLGGYALYLAHAGRRLSDALKAGDIASAVVQGSTRHLLVISTRAHLVALVVAADTEVGTAELEMRRALTGP